MSEPGRPKCTVCGRLFWCDYPNQWAYKRGTVFLCSWRCLRKYDKRKEADGMQGKAILTDKQKRKAIEMALNGESPLQYIKECGAANPTTTWQSVLNWAKKNCDRNVYEELPEKFGQQKKANGVDVPPPKPGEPKPPAETEMEMIHDPQEKPTQTKPDLPPPRLELCDLTEKLVTVPYPEQQEKVTAEERLPIASVWSRVLKTGTYTKVNGIGMMLKGIDYQMMLSAEDWRKFAEEIGIALEMLKPDETVEV